MEDGLEETAEGGSRRGPRNGVIVVSCVAFVATMTGMAFAAVPLYRLFCEITGFGGTPGISTAGPLAAIDRDMTVRFDANVSGGLPWTFRPVERSVSFKVGEVMEVAYEVTNASSETTWGTSTYNVTPFISGGYFHKIQCFCFEAQKLEPGETRVMPVVFYVDPAIEDEREADSVETITLSYTFFPAPRDQIPAIASSPPADGPAPAL